MASYVSITLDTTPPILQIFIPQYTAKDTLNNVLVKSNEKIVNLKTYSVDSKGRREDYTLAPLSENEYYGFVQFTNASIGVLTFYAQCEDEVGNVSVLQEVTTNVIEKTEILRCSIVSVVQQELCIDIKTNNVQTLVKQMYVQDSLTERLVTTDVKERKVEISCIQ